MSSATPSPSLALSSGLAAALTVCLAVPVALAADPISFEGKTITMVISSEAGGGTDASCRLVGNFLSKHLPGQPALIVRNIGAGRGMAALNYVVQQTKPDGLTVIGGSSSQVDPLQYRNANVHYDPAEFKFIGGIGLGGAVVLINRDAEKRLYDKTAAPVVMGSTSVPQSGMQVALWGVEYLGWNVRWVSGYRGANDVMLALERGEVDMTSTQSMSVINRFSRGNFRILNQTGAIANGKFVARADFGDAPLFPQQMTGKLADKVSQSTFDYWQNRNSTEKWVALGPGTPDAVVKTYRDTFLRIAQDKDFIAQGEKLSEGFTPQPSADIEFLVQSLAHTPPEAIAFMKALMNKQGLRVE